MFIQNIGSTIQVLPSAFFNNAEKGGQITPAGYSLAFPYQKEVKVNSIIASCRLIKITSPFELCMNYITNWNFQFSFTTVNNNFLLTPVGIITTPTTPNSNIPVVAGVAANRYAVYNDAPYMQLNNIKAAGYRMRSFAAKIDYSTNVPSDTDYRVVFEIISNITID